MQEHGMYGERARYYDPIYHWKDYPADATRLHGLLSDAGVADGSRVVEAACGTGSYLAALRKWYDVAGFDRSESMLEVARGKLPETQVWQADMRDFTLPQPADALLCLFSSIGYLRDLEQLRAAAGCFARAVRPGGLLIVEPWLTRETYWLGHAHIDVYKSDVLNLARASVPQLEGELAVIEFHWLVARQGAAAVEHFTDRHEMWLCPTATLLDVFTEAGFTMRHEPEGLTPARGLLIGMRS